MKHTQYSCDLCETIRPEKEIVGFKFSSHGATYSIEWAKDLDEASFHLCIECLDALDKCLAANSNKIFCKLEATRGGKDG